jgi:phosphatidylglycerophosphatase C
MVGLEACETSAVNEQPTPVVAAFDLDGTLTEGGSVFPWLRRVAGSGNTYWAVLRLIVPLVTGALRSSQWADSAKERLFKKLLRGRDEEKIQEVSREFANDHLAHQERSRIIERLKWHQSQGHEVLIVSASPQLYVDVVAEILHADGALGTRLAVDPIGRLTGGYLGKNCRGTEKMRRLNEWISLRDYPTEPVIYAYGNSRGDRRLLAGATYPFDAGKLGPFGALRHFPRMTSPQLD